MDSSWLSIIFFFSLFIILLILSHRYFRETLKRLFKYQKIQVIDHNYIKNLLNKLTLKVNDKNDLYSFELAEKYLKANQFEKAEECFLIALQNSSITAPPQIIRYLAKNSFATHNFKKAIEYYSKLEASNHLEPNELFEIGLSLLKDNEANKAETYLLKAINLDENNSVYLHEFLDFCLASGKCNQFTLMLTKIAEISQDPDVLKKIILIFETINEVSLILKIKQKIANLLKSN